MSVYVNPKGESVMTCKKTGIGETRPISRRIDDYWDLRAEGYSKYTRIALEKGQDEIIHIIGRIINIERPLKMIDMGTGPGLYAILMAMKGHEVTAIDRSEKMLKEARMNAEAAGVKINFIKADVENPHLDARSFDFIISHNVVWNLENPEKAYENWKGLLKPTGAMAIIDGNYYLDLYDEDYRKRMKYLKFVKKDPTNGIHAKTNVGNVDFNIMEDIAKELPLSRERRPSWDVAVLMGVGMTDIHIKSLDKEPFSVLTETGMTELPSTFIICCRTPVAKSPYLDAVNYPINDDNIKWIADSVAGKEYRIADILKAMADVKRLRIINALQVCNLNVQQLSFISGCSHSLTSHDLSILRDAGIVVQNKVGREVTYRLRDRNRIQIILEMCDSLLHKSEYGGEYQ